MLKKIFDYSISILALAILWPVMLITGILVLIFLGQPVLFSQKRLGYNGAIFRIFKFRTMTNKSDADGKLLPSNERLTPFGVFLRKTSLDELPGLFNVLNGTMSIVGPRPLLVDYKELYSREQFRRHEVLPGITGLAQVKGRNHLSWEEKFELDVWYVDNKSFLLDIKIVILTFFRVFASKAVSPKDGKISKRFTGTQQEL